ncbi:hypothetical protein [Cellulomonas sp. P24]|uniref:hypothetical protein n=1 Tax=Cellulomonas sp. P24 TaxID=2885206 RepID=UPI00216B463F|nr:hypothetical protein [Cellulomonas sp. P24]MCR6494487.1 hypothetical protein [Cellulomonas sp. P24]
MTPSRDHDLSNLKLARAIADVQGDPAWAGATPDEQLAEVVHRLGENAAAAFADARAALVADIEDRLLTTIDDAPFDQ